jgi:hypothetical protein
MTGRWILVTLRLVTLCLLVARPAAAQLLANGTSLTVTTTNAVATFTGADLTGYVNQVTGEVYLKNPSSGNLAGINSFTSSGAWTTSNWTIGTEAGTGVPLATIVAHDNVRSLTMTVKIDTASQEVVLKLSASVTTPGMRQAWWSVAGLDVGGGRLIVPANSGMVFDKSHPLDTFVMYPNNWHAQMAVYETSLGSFILYSTDSQVAFKWLRAATRGESTIDVTLATEATAPFGTATTVPTVEWRLKAFAGTWRTAAQVYRDWLNVNRPPVSNAAHPWVSNIRTVATLRILDPGILPLLAAKVSPAQTLLYLVDWRVDRFDVNLPNYTPRAGVSSFVAAAHALGFKVMLHLTIQGVSPLNPDYNTVKAWHTRGAELLEPLGWNWNQPSTTGRYAFINLAAPAYRSLFINRISAAVNSLAADALHLDISGPMINDGNGLINGMSYAQGSAQLHQDLIAAFPAVALGGEGENDIIYRYQSFAQSWWLSTANAGHPIAAYLFSPQVQFYGHLGQPLARESGFKNYAAELAVRAMHPTLAVTFPADLDTNNPDNARLLTWLQSWQTHAFSPAWAADWTGAVVRHQGTGGATAALTDTGTKMTLDAAGSTLFTLAHDANQVASPPYPSRWLAFDGVTSYGLDPSKRYFLDQASALTSTHLTSLPAGVRLGPGSLLTPSVAHIELLPPVPFDFQNQLLNAHMGVRYNGSESPLGLGAVVQMQTVTAGGQTRSGMFIHPPWQGQVGGETFVEYSVAVPAGGSLQFDVAVDDAATCTDGVTFRVTISGAELWHEHITRTGWQHRSVSLAAYGGSTVPLRIISHPGPAGNPSCDWAMWNQVSLTAPSTPISTPFVLAAGSVASGFAGDGSLALNGLSGTVSNVRVPGHFTLFTQPGTSVSIGTNLANVPFGVWNGAHGELVVPGSVYYAGSIISASSGGVVKNPVIVATPLDHGRTVLSFSIRLAAAPQRLSWSAGILDGSSTTDGVEFQVVINGVMRWRKTTLANQWMPGIIDLSPLAGQTILVELITDSVGFGAFDEALWGDLVLRDSGFTDNLLTSALTTIKRVHITELRDRINALRARAGLGAYAWTDPSLVMGASQVRAQHVVDLRTALAQAYVAMSRSAPVYSDPSLSPGVNVRAVHVSELRAAVLAIE